MRHPDESQGLGNDRNETGETQALIGLETDRLIVVWRAQSRTWVPVAEQVAALVTSLPERTRQEVLDFARFLYERSRSPRRAL